MPKRLPWGKAHAGRSHHLAHHCADVAACFEALAGLPVIRARMEESAGGELGDVDVTRLSLLVFLHDCGKLHPGFQLRGTFQGVTWPDRASHGHVLEGAAILLGRDQAKIATSLHIPHLKGWGLQALREAVLAHHGRPFGHDLHAGQIGWQAIPEIPYDPVAAAQQMGALMRVWFAPAFADGAAERTFPPAFQHFFCGLVSLADWLGSTPSLFPFVAECDAAYMEQARLRARQAVVGVGLDVDGWRRTIEGRATFTVLSPGRTPRPAQALAAEWPLDDPLIILEAETGSGKTEAALWRFARLFEAGKVDSLYFALPTQASARQIHGRVNLALKRLFGDGAPEAVLAVPGYLRAGDVAGATLPDYEVLWDDVPDEATRVARWAAESSKRYLAATVAVGTVDQAMLAALQIKHAHLRAAALSRSLLVIDEVHASDPYMTSIQGDLLRMHIKRGGHTMLMSATLGAEARGRWLARSRRAPPLEPFAATIATPYPAVSGLKNGCRAAESRSQDRKAVAMALVEDWRAATAAARAVDAAVKGARVLVIRNTVTAAIDTFAAVKAMGAQGLLWNVAGGPALHHARFAPEDRRLLDAEVERALSKASGERHPGGLIVIASPTLQQALDICADHLITDLCPIDVLLQRIGRLHRHDLPRPLGFEAPRCLVLSPEQGLDRLTAPAFDNGLGQFAKGGAKGGGIYRNLHAAELTRRLVLDHPTWIIPEMNRFLVETALHPDRIEALTLEKGKPWEHYWNSVSGQDAAQRQFAGNITVPDETDFADLQSFPTDEVTIRTRLGAEGARLVFETPVPGPFSQSITGLTLPAHWHGSFDERPRILAAEEGVVRFTLGTEVFQYDREGVKRGR